VVNLPNALTALRILLVPVLVAVLLTRLEHGLFLGAGIFGLAVLTDYLDGYLARRRNQVTRLGILLDPLADKLLTDFAWAALAMVGYAPVWLATAVVARDVFVAAVWGWGWLRGWAWPPRPSGQIAIAFEGVAVSVLLFHGPWVDVHWPTVGAVLGTIALALSVVQLLEYAGGRTPLNRRSRVDPPHRRSRVDNS
jgi:CDP-diacylglycerol--glycerol-3-phosphate 3-phosphatidyltransferase